MSQYTKYPLSGGGGGGVSSLNGQTGALTLVAGSGITITPGAGTLTIDATGAPTGTPNTVSGYDSLGNIGSIPGFDVSTVSGGLDINLTIEPDNNVGGFEVHDKYVRFEPLQNSPDEGWTIDRAQAEMDFADSGFSQGTTGTAVTVRRNEVIHLGTGNVGDLALNNNYFNLGNGTDPITVGGMSYSYGFGNVNANVTIDGGVQGYGFQPSFDVAAIVDPTSFFNPFYDFANIPLAVPSYTSFSASPTIGSILNNNGITSFNANPNITTLTGNAGWTGFNAAGTIGTVNSGFVSGVNIAPTVTLNNGNVVGINVTMDNVTNFAGVASSVVIQDITYTFIAPGDNNSYTIEYLDTTTAGNETFTILGNAITCNMESGVSTATQIAAAAALNLGFIGAVNVVITGVGSNPQNAVAATPFAGGINPGVSRAAQFDGDVSIDGNLSFTGALSIGQLSSFAPYTIVSGTGTPASIDILVTSPTVPASATLTNADTFGVNTAMLLNVGAGATVTTSFLGITALALPAVVTMGAGSSVDRIDGAAFAISLDSGAGGGTITNVDLCRALAIPNGVTTVTNLKAFAFDLPFGDPGTTTWGLHVSPQVNNYVAGNLVIGPDSETPVNSSVGLEIASTAKAILLSRMTTAQKNALTAVAGMMVFDTDLAKLCYYDGAVWVAV